MDGQRNRALEVRPDFLGMVAGIPVAEFVLLSIHYYLGWSIPRLVVYAVAAVAVVGGRRLGQRASLRTTAMVLIVGLAGLAALVLIRYTK